MATEGTARGWAGGMGEDRSRGTMDSDKKHNDKEKEEPCGSEASTDKLLCV